MSKVCLLLHVMHHCWGERVLARSSNAKEWKAWKKDASLLLSLKAHFLNPNVKVYIQNSFKYCSVVLNTMPMEKLHMVDSIVDTFFGMLDDGNIFPFILHLILCDERSTFSLWFVCHCICYINVYRCKRFMQLSELPRKMQNSKAWKKKNISVFFDKVSFSFICCTFYKKYRHTYKIKIIQYM